MVNVCMLSRVQVFVTLWTVPAPPRPHLPVLLSLCFSLLESGLSSSSQGLCHPHVLPTTPEAPTAICVSQVRLLKPRNEAAWPRVSKPRRGTYHTSALPHPPAYADLSDTLH